MRDEELVERSVQGDRAAMDELVRENQERIYHHCLRLVHDEALAEDLTQETFVKAFEHLASFKQKSRFSTWVWRIAHNLCLNALKKRSFQEHPLNEEILAGKEAQGESAFLKKIEEAMQTLDEEHRIVFELYDLQHVPQKQIAAQLGIPHGTVRSRLHYARKKIRAYLKEFPPTT